MCLLGFGFGFVLRFLAAHGFSPSDGPSDDLPSDPPTTLS